MYFWNDLKLADDLNKDIVSEKQTMNYFLILSVLFTIFYSSVFLSTIYHNVELTTFDYLIDISNIILIVLSIFLSYKYNGGNEGKDFVKRYTCLSLPIIVKTIIFLIPLTILFAGKDDPRFHDVDYEGPLLTGPFTFTITTFFLAYILYRYILCFKIASGQKEYNK